MTCFITLCSQKCQYIRPCSLLYTRKCMATMADGMTYWAYDVVLFAVQEQFAKTLVEVVKTSVYILLVVVVMLSLSDVATGYHHLYRTIKSSADTSHVSFYADHTSRHFSDDVRASRQRRRELREPTPLTPQRIREVVDTHNRLRAGEGASNMERMMWSEFLGSLAANWTARCVFKHGNPPLGKDPPLRSIGQNLFATGASVVNLTTGILLWYSEKKKCHYDLLECIDGCGHYTAVVWATSRYVGCGVHSCKSSSILACNYGPAGNMIGSTRYRKGPACSQCPSGAGWCKDGLCNSNCSAPSDDCKCAAHCHNCATLNPDTCQCSCADGWQGPYCTVPRDSNAVAGRCPPVLGPDAYSLSTQTMFTKEQAAILLMIIIALTIVSDVIIL